MVSKIGEHGKEEQGTIEILLKIEFDNKMFFTLFVGLRFLEPSETPSLDRRQGEEPSDVKF